MKKRARTLLACLLLAWFGGPIAFSQAGSPSYLILRAPAQTREGHRGRAGHRYYPGRGKAVTTQTYAYGWFGAHPRRQWTRSTGYYASYIQWTAQ